MSTIKFEVLPKETESLFNEIFKELEDPFATLDGWLRIRKVHYELVINDQITLSELLEIGASALKFSQDRGLRIFQTECETDSVTLFWASSAEAIFDALVEIKTKEMVVHQVMTA